MATCEELKAFKAKATKEHEEITLSPDLESAEDGLKEACKVIALKDLDPKNDYKSYFQQKAC